MANDSNVSGSLWDNPWFFAADKATVGPSLTCPVTGHSCEGDLSHLCNEYGCARKDGLSPRSDENQLLQGSRSPRKILVSSRFRQRSHETRSGLPRIFSNRSGSGSKPSGK